MSFVSARKRYTGKGLTETELWNKLNALAFDWDNGTDDEYEEYVYEQAGLQEALRELGADPNQPPANKPAAEPKARDNRGRYESTVQRPKAAPFVEQQLDATDMAGMTEAEITEATARGQFQALDSDKGYVNVDRLILEDEAKETAEAKAEWGRQQVAELKRQEKIAFNEALEAHNAERVKKGLNPIEMPEQLDPKGWDVNDDPEGFIRAQASGAFVNAMGTPVGDFIVGYEQYEAKGIASMAKGALEKLAKGPEDVIAGAHELAGLSKGELTIAREAGVKISESVVQEASGQVQAQFRAQAEALYGS